MVFRSKFVSYNVNIFKIIYKKFPVEKYINLIIKFDVKNLFANETISEKFKNYILKTHYLDINLKYIFI